MYVVCCFIRFSFPLALELCSFAFQEVVFTPPEKIADSEKSFGKCAEVLLPLAADRDIKVS